MIYVIPGNPIVPVIPVPVVPGLPKSEATYRVLADIKHTAVVVNAVMANSRNSPFGQSIIAGIKNETLAKGKAVIAK